MFNRIILRKIGVFTLFVFIFLVGTAEYSFADEEDILLKARKYYQQGNYDESVKVLQKFIENLQAIVEQKKNVAEAFYLLAKVYYTVGEDAEVEKNLKKVYETFPSFSKEENDIEFQKRILKVRNEMGLKEVISQPVKKQPVKKVIQKEGKKKKKFPILLVAGGIVIIALLVILLTKKKKEEDVYDLRGRWAVHESLPAGDIFPDGIEDDLTFTFSGQLGSGTFVDSYGDVGVYRIEGQEITIRYTDLNPAITIRLLGSFQSTTRIGGEIIVTVNDLTARGDWSGSKAGANNSTTNNISGQHSSLVKHLMSIKL